MLFNKGDYSSLRRDLDMDWESLLAEKSTEECWSIIKDRILTACSRYIPTVTINNNSAWKQPWMNSRCMGKVKENCTAGRMYKKSQLHSDKCKYTRARNQARWACRKAVKEHEKTIAKLTKTNSKAFWKYIKSKLKNKDPVAELETESGRACSDQEKANELNTFFKSVFTIEDNSNPSTLPRKDYNSPLTHINIDEEEIRDYLENLNINKSPGPDRLNPRVLKETSAQLSKAFAVLYKQSLREGTLPVE